MDRTHAFFERYGGRAIVLAQFVPFVRTYIPVAAGGIRKPKPGAPIPRPWRRRASLPAGERVVRSEFRCPRQLSPRLYAPRLRFSDSGVPW